jgi:hypothetical protein
MIGGNNIIVIQGADTVRTIPIIMKLGTPTKRLEVLVFHLKISNEEEDLMFATKLGLFSLGTIVVPTSVWSNQLVKLITSTKFKFNQIG